MDAVSDNEVEAYATPRLPEKDLCAPGMREPTLGEASSARLRFGILGPLQVLRDGHVMDLGSRKQQQVLAVLLCHANTPVTVESLIDSLWGEGPPRTARKNIQVYVSGLRALLGAPVSAPRIAYRANAYVLSVDEDELDWLRFKRKVRDTQLLLDREQITAVAQALREALALWRGPVLDGMRGTAAVDEAAQRLEERFLTVFEDWAEAELTTGASLCVAERIVALAQRHPFRERLRMAQMTALSQIGRRTEALAVFDEVRRSLASEFGLAPSAALAKLHRSLLNEQEPVAARPLKQVRSRPAAYTLPGDVPDFTGRDEHTRELVNALADAGERLVVISGPTGVGKTALAVHAAHLLRERFPDGCCYVRMRREDREPRPTTEVASQLTSVVNGPSEPRRPYPVAAADAAAVNGGDTVAGWQHWLATHRTLVVLDDPRYEAQVRPVLPEAGESAVIVTARTRLAGLGHAHRLSLPPFRTSEAVDLLRRVIGDRRVDGAPAVAGRIVAAVGRLPLAVRVVGDKLDGLDHVPLKEYLVRLESAPNLLDELTVGDVAVRGRMAEAVADLNPAAVNAFRQLGTLPQGAFMLHEAAAALHSDEETAIRTLESLLEISLMAAPDVETIAHDVVYEMPALIHAYARELAQPCPDPPKLRL